MDTEARRLRSSSGVKTTAEMPDDTTANNFTAKMPKNEVKVKFPWGNCSNTTLGCAALLCNVCEHWHPKECIPDASFQTLSSMKETMGCVFFLCSKCEKVHKKTWQDVTQHGKRVDCIEKHLYEHEK